MTIFRLKLKVFRVKENSEVSLIGKISTFGSQAFVSFSFLTILTNLLLNETDLVVGLLELLTYRNAENV